MEKTTLILKNEQGSAIVVAILVLVLLTIIGAAATQNSITELAIVRNDLLYKDQLLNAEGAAMEAAQFINNAADTSLQDVSLTAGLSVTDIVLTALDLNDGEWEMSALDDDQTAGASITGYRMVDQTGPVMLIDPITHTYSIYGLHNRTTGISQGQVLVELGYRKKF